MDAAQRITSRLPAQLRLNDFDVLGHLNQAVYHELLELGRIDLVTGLSLDNDDFVLAHVELDYRREIAKPERSVTVETEIERVGRSSVRMRQRVVRGDGVVAAEGSSVLVGWDRAARGSRPLGDAERAALQAHAAPAAAAS